MDTEPIPEDECKEGANDERRVEYEEGEHILNVLLTTSIMVNEQLNQTESSDKIDEPISDENFTRPLPYDSVITTCLNNELDLKIDDPVCDSHVENYFQLDTSCDVAREGTISYDKVSDETFDEIRRESSDELESALEHMKIDALEILFSSSTLESIKNESYAVTENFASFDVPVIIMEGETSLNESKGSTSYTSPIEGSDETCVSQLQFTSYGGGPQTPENESNLLDRSIEDKQIVEDLMRYSPEKESISVFDNLVSDKFMENEPFNFDIFETQSNTITFPSEYKTSNDLLDFEDSPSPVKATSNAVDCLEGKKNRCYESNDNYTLETERNGEIVDSINANDKSSILPLDIFDNQYNFSAHQSDGNESQLVDLKQETSYNTVLFATSPSESDSNLEKPIKSINKDLDSECDHNEQLNNTETALQNILRENTEVLKKVYHKYTSSQSCDFDLVSNYCDGIHSDGESESFNNLPRSRLKTKDIKFLSLDHPIHVDESKKRRRRIHKSLDSLNTKKSKLKIGLLSKSCKWISISIDNSDLALLNVPSENSNKPAKSEFRNSPNTKSSRIRSSNAESKKKDLNSSEYLHLNFDIIGTGRKKKDPIQEYVHKKNVLSQNFKSSSELAPLNFNPFPSRSNTRPPKELGVKLGLYSSNKTK